MAADQHFDAIDREGGDFKPFDPTRPHYKLYSQNAIDLATFLGTPIAGTLLLAANFRKLDNHDSSRNTIILGFVGFAIYAYALIWLSPALDVVPNAAFTFLQLAVIHTYGKWKQAEALRRHEELAGAFHSKWRAAGISLLAVPLSLALFFLATLTTIPEQTTPENIEVSVDAPPVVEQGANFQIQVHLNNTGDHEQTLIYTFITDELLAGIVIEGSEPPFSQSLQVPFLGTSFDYALVIPPQSELTITFFASAADRGTHVGDIDFHINSERNVLFYVLQITVV